MDKFCSVKLDKLELAITIHSEAKIVKNPIPILWNFKGSYFWIPVEVVKNEIEACFYLRGIHVDSSPKAIYFTLQQAYPIRADIGKILWES